MDKDIEKALFEAVTAMTFAPPLPIAWPNVNFDKPNDQRYLEVIHFVNDPIDYVWDDDNPGIHQGILQINVHLGINLGTLSMRSVAEIIVATFKKGTILTSGSAKVHINRVPAQGSHVNEENFIPVRIFYRTID